ncbi:MAG TPA: hypothetical protein VF556_12180 [Pyrinomonadaceae bacterium]|jgi:hypothetical protein
MKRKITVMVFALSLIYISGYFILRQTDQEIWESGGKVYVIFPEDKILYYLYRPMSIIDEKLTGIKFHIGPHR